ncbi:MAG: hypothetical protein LBN43_09000 [Oscillospiraceae bacterium]|jgi:hypothetical protein|nr:hypothetical protein [Oscillospiraceae bacterium]
MNTELEQANERLLSAKANAEQTSAQLKANLAEPLWGSRKATLPAIIMLVGCVLGFASRYASDIPQILFAAIALILCGLALFIRRAKRASRHDDLIVEERHRLSEANDLAQEKYTKAVEYYREIERQSKR